jgi:hypothetical protein
MERNAAVSSMPNPSRPTRDTGILLISEPPCSTIYGVSRMLLVTAAYGQGKTSRPAAARSRIVGVQDPVRLGSSAEQAVDLAAMGNAGPSGWASQQVDVPRRRKRYALGILLGLHRGDACRICYVPAQDRRASVG